MRNQFYGGEEKGENKKPQNLWGRNSLEVYKMTWNPMYVMTEL